LRQIDEDGTHTAEAVQQLAMHDQMMHEKTCIFCIKMATAFPSCCARRLCSDPAAAN
jgi:hypothetical protein